MLRDGDADGGAVAGADRGLHRTGRWSQPTSPALASTGWLVAGGSCTISTSTTSPSPLIERSTLIARVPPNGRRPDPAIPGTTCLTCRIRAPRRMAPLGGPLGGHRAQPFTFGVEPGFAQDPTTSVPGRGDRRVVLCDGVAGGRSGDRRAGSPRATTVTPTLSAAPSRRPAPGPPRPGCSLPVSPTGSWRSSAARPCASRRGRAARRTALQGGPDAPSGVGTSSPRPRTSPGLVLGLGPRSSGGRRVGARSLYCTTFPPHPPRPSRGRTRFVDELRGCSRSHPGPISRHHGMVGQHLVVGLELPHEAAGG